MAVLNRSSSSAEEDAASAIIRSHHGADDEEEKSLTLTQTIPHHAPPYPYNPPSPSTSTCLLKHSETAIQIDSQAERQTASQTEKGRGGSRGYGRLREGRGGRGSHPDVKTFLLIVDDVDLFLLFLYICLIIRLRHALCICVFLHVSVSMSGSRTVHLCMSVIGCVSVYVCKFLCL